jgi:hypothetical protein
MLLVTLEYLREYRAYARIAADFGLDESGAAVDTLIKDGTFSPPGHEAPLKSDIEFEVVLIDATKTPDGCPKRGAP